MTEPDVAITDYLLAIESAILATLLTSQPATRPDLQRWYIVFFAATACASVLGGTVHGFFSTRVSRTGIVLWRGALMAIGVVAASGAMIGALVLWHGAHAGVMLTGVTAAFVAYSIVVIAVSDAFSVAVATYLPSTFFLVVAYMAASRSDPDHAIAVGLAGLVLTLVAAAGQRLRIAVHPIYFTHNAVYHAIQGIALVMIFWSGRYLIRAD